MPNRLQLISSPTDSFVDYFLDTKPYHTKILEITETYTFTEEMVVSFEEQVLQDIHIENDALCKQTGFGLDFDDECGYDAIDCCSLFDCYGGYGLIFDNSDKLLDLTVTNFAVEDFSNPLATVESFVEVGGNRLADLRLPIKSIPDPTTLILDGNHQNLFNVHSTFLIVNVQQFDIIDNDSATVFIQGNHTSFFSPKNEFYILGQTKQNSIHYYHDVTYDPIIDRTELHLSTPAIDNELAGFTLQIRNSNDNNGIYQSLNNSYDAGQDETTVELATGELIALAEGDYGLGSIQLRTGLRNPRNIEILNEDTDVREEHRISYSEYDVVNDTTRVYTFGTLEFLTGANAVRLETYGYFFESGFDSDAECSVPKASNVHTGLVEYLFLEVEDPEASLIWVDTTSDWQIEENFFNVSFDGECFVYGWHWSGTSDPIILPQSTVNTMWGIRFELLLSGDEPDLSTDIEIISNAGTFSTNITLINGETYYLEINETDEIFDGTNPGEITLNISPPEDWYTDTILCNIEVLIEDES